MHATSSLTRGGTSVPQALGASTNSRSCPHSLSRQRRSGSGSSGMPIASSSSTPAAAPAAFGPSPYLARRAPVSTRALNPSSSEFRLQRRRRLVSSQQQQQRLLSPPSPSPLATTNLLLSLPSTTPAALRASDSDDPSDEEEEEEDDPSLELTAEELAMAFSEDVKPREEEEEEEEEEVEEEFEVAAASTPSSSSAAAAEEEEEEDDARALALELARVAADIKASDVVVLHVAPLVYWTSFMVLCTVYSRPQLGAVLAKAESAAAGERFGRDLGGARGAGRSPWEVLDFGDVVMHCFTPDQREFYDLEGFYGAAEEVELPAEVSGAGSGVSGIVGGKRDASSWANRA